MHGPDTQYMDCCEHEKRKNAGATNEDTYSDNASTWVSNLLYEHIKAFRNPHKEARNGTNGKLEPQSKNYRKRSNQPTTMNNLAVGTFVYQAAQVSKQSEFGQKHYVSMETFHDHRRTEPTEEY